MIRWLVGIAALLSTLAAAALSTDTTAPDTPEPGSIEAIAKATGDPRFLSPWVSYLPQAHGVPSPLAFFGRIPGTPGEFVDTAKAHAYCRALAAASPRVRVFSIGRSEERSEERRVGKERATGWRQNGQRPKPCNTAQR